MEIGHAFAYYVHDAVITRNDFHKGRPFARPPRNWLARGLFSVFSAVSWRKFLKKNVILIIWDATKSMRRHNEENSHFGDHARHKKESNTKWWLDRTWSLGWGHWHLRYLYVHMILRENYHAWGWYGTAAIADSADVKLRLQRIDTSSIPPLIVFFSLCRE